VVVDLYAGARYTYLDTKLKRVAALLRAIATGAAVIAAAGVCAAKAIAQPVDAPTFVGSATCGECHQEEMAAWRGSHHDLAMQEATAETVLGDFDDASFTPRGRHLALLQARRQGLRHHRRAGRSARRLRDRLHGAVRQKRTGLRWAEDAGFQAAQI